MKKLVITLTLLAGAFAQVQAEDISVSGTVGYESQYIFRGVALADGYFSPAVDVSVGDFYAGAWSALPIDSEFDEEIDLYAGMNNQIGDVSTLDLGLTVYTYPSADVDSTVEIYAGLSWELALSPSLYVFYDIDLDTLTGEFSIGKTLEMSEKNSLEWGAHLGIAMPDVGNSVTYGGLSLAYRLTLSEDVSASIGTNYYIATNDIVTGSKAELTVAASITAGF